MIRTNKVLADHLCCHNRSGRTACAYILGLPGTPMPVHKWSGLNINGPPQFVMHTPDNYAGTNFAAKLRYLKQYDRILENRRYTHYSSFVINAFKKYGYKTQAPEKNTQVFISSLVGELSRQWTNSGNHLVRLSIGSTKIFVSSPYT